MVNHISSKSIAEFLAKILTFESSILVSSEDEIYNVREICDYSSQYLKIDQEKYGFTACYKEIGSQIWHWRNQ